MSKVITSAERKLASMGDLSISPSEFSDLVGLVYQGLIERLPWSSILCAMRNISNANWVTLILRPASESQPALIINSGPNGAFQEAGQFTSYSTFAIDPFANLSPERVFSVDEVLGENQWTNTPFYTEFVAPYDIRYMVGADIRLPDGTECRLRWCRPARANDFGPRERGLFQMLVPHFKRAIVLHSRLDQVESERQLYAGAVDRMLLGTVIFDESGAILKVNRVAEEIFAEKDGLSLAHGTVEATYADENRELHRLIRQAITGVTGVAQMVGQALAVTRPSGRSKYGVAIRSVPIGAWSEGKHRPAATIFIRDPERKSQASQDVIQQLFEFTPAEAALALRLADGLTLDEAADELNIRKNTARAHLRSIFSKTGVTRQTALVRLLLGSVTAMD